MIKMYREKYDYRIRFCFRSVAIKPVKSPRFGTRLNNALACRFTTVTLRAGGILRMWRLSSNLILY